MQETFERVTERHGGIDFCLRRLEWGHPRGPRAGGLGVVMMGNLRGFIGPR